MEKNYLVVDLGTGNSRVALVSSKGVIWGIRSYVNQYYKDPLYDDAQYFLPEEWKKFLLAGCKELVAENPEHKVTAITSSGARESIVLFNKDGEAFMGLPNIDNRGRAWMEEIGNRSYIYERTGRWVTEDFPAAKLMGYRKKHPHEYGQIAKITSLSEWIGEVFTGQIVIEPSQACETQLFDIETLQWSEQICGHYGITVDMLPKICKAGNSIGVIKKDVAAELDIPEDAEFLVGGADTQVAVKGSRITLGDVAIVSGTTSPVVTIVDSKYYDEQERCWTDCNLGGDTYQVETNPGVTGLNYQRIKKMLFAETSYEKLDSLMTEQKEFLCTASFTSLYFSKKQALKVGGFVMNAPFDAACEPVNLIYAVMADTACSISVQYKNLCEMLPHTKDYILGCGGGFQSKVLCQMIADLTEKEVIIKEGFEQASIYGCMEICNEHYGIKENKDIRKEWKFKPCRESLIHKYYPVWLKNQRMLNPVKQG